MRISTKLAMASLIPALMALVTAAGMFSSYRSINSLENKEIVAYRISNELSELNGLVRTYILYHEERPVRQFFIKHEETKNLIAGLTFEDRRRRQFVEGIARNTETIKVLFLKLVSNREFHGSAGDARLIEEAERRLLGQVLIRSRAAKADASRLTILMSEEIIAGQRRISYLVIVLLAAAVVVCTTLLLGMTNKLTGSLERLRNGAGIVGSGNFDHRIGISSEDEIGALSASFDLMTGKLKETTVSLHESETRFRTLIENSPVGVSLVRDRRVLFINPEQRRLFGSIPEEFDLREFRDVHPEDSGRFARLCEAVSVGGTGSLETDLRFFPYGKSVEGTEMRWVHLRAIPLVYSGENCTLLSMVDITGRKEMELQLMAQEKMASLGQIAAGIAHEIRNPLSGINIYLSALEEVQEAPELQDEERKEAIRRIMEQLHSASSRIEDVIKKVMGFTQTRAPRMEAIDINLAIEEAIDFTSTHLRKIGITLVRSLPKDHPRCRADHQLIAQVLVNMISNAAQAMENAAAPKTIEISSVVENGKIVIRVADSGPGVPQAVRDKIFAPFYTTRKDGYGIGLSFCRRVIGDHGGTLSVAAGPLGGAEFRIEIPAGEGEVVA
ncbi:MAG: PAS domain S-box protein [Deltaproteobacteria bacterium]|nr:PAS domain S-box protein [Deltaproteobacteria bacterium]